MKPTFTSSPSFLFAQLFCPVCLIRFWYIEAPVDDFSSLRPIVSVPGGLGNRSVESVEKFKIQT